MIWRYRCGGPRSIYRPDSDVLCPENPDSVSGDPVLPGFVLDLARVWS
jgi:hypothetical protein